MIIPKTISAIKESETRESFTEIIQCLSYLDDVVRPLLGDRKIHIYAVDESEFLKVVLNGEVEDSKKYSLQDLKAEVHQELICFNEIIAENIKFQISALDKAGGKLKNKYKVIPDSIDREIVTDEISKRYLMIDEIFRSNISDEDFFKRLLEEVKKLEEYYVKKMKEIWSQIQSVEKYYNDNGRYFMAKLALSMSIGAILLSLVNITYQNYVISKNSETLKLNLTEALSEFFERR